MKMIFHEFVRCVALQVTKWGTSEGNTQGYHGNPQQGAWQSITILQACLYSKSNSFAVDVHFSTILHFLFRFSLFSLIKECKEISQGGIPTWIFIFLYFLVFNFYLCERKFYYLITTVDAGSTKKGSKGICSNSWRKLFDLQKQGMLTAFYNYPAIYFQLLLVLQFSSSSSSSATSSDWRLANERGSINLRQKIP